MLPEKPCDSCKEVPVPYLCERKSCKRWREWFVQRWNAMGQPREPRRCAFCGAPLPLWSRSCQKYCDQSCQNKASNQRRQRRKNTKEET